MAISFVAESHISANGTGSTLTVTKPTGTQNGDYILVFCANIANHSYTPPEGWTSIYDTSENNDNVAQGVFGKIASDEGASWVFTQSTESWHSWFALAYRGVDSASPLDSYYTGDPYITSDTAVRASSITVANVSALVVWLGSWYVNGGEPAGDPSGFSERIDYLGTGLHYVWVGDKAFTAGATGNVDLTVTSATTYKDACMVALKPAADAPEAPTINAYQSGSNIIVAWS